MFEIVRSLSKFNRHEFTNTSVYYIHFESFSIKIGNKNNHYVSFFEDKTDHFLTLFLEEEFTILEKSSLNKLDSIQIPNIILDDIQNYDDTELLFSLGKSVTDDHLLKFINHKIHDFDLNLILSLFDKVPECLNSKC